MAPVVVLSCSPWLLVLAARPGYSSWLLACLRRVVRGLWPVACWPAGLCPVPRAPCPVPRAPCPVPRAPWLWGGAAVMKRAYAACSALGAAFNIKLIDFGFSRPYLEGQEFTDMIGTPFYIPPEVIARKYLGSAAGDMWSMGVILFMYVTLTCRPLTPSHARTLHALHVHTPILSHTHTHALAHSLSHTHTHTPLSPPHTLRRGRCNHAYSQRANSL